MPTTTFSTLFITFIFTTLFSIHIYAVDINLDANITKVFSRDGNTSSDTYKKGIILSDEPISVKSLGAGHKREGGYIMHEVKMSGIASTSRTYAYSIKDNTTKAGDDYNPIPEFKSTDNVTFNSTDSTINVPAGIDKFQMYISTYRDDINNEGNETYTITIGDKNNTGTVINDSL